MFTCVPVEGPPAVGRHEVDLRAPAAGEAALRESADSGGLGDDKGGLGRFRNSAVDIFIAAAMAVGFFAARRSSVIAQLVSSDVEVDGAEETVWIRAVRREMADWVRVSWRQWSQSRPGVKRSS